MTSFTCQQQQTKKENKNYHCRHTPPQSTRLLRRLVAMLLSCRTCGFRSACTEWLTLGLRSVTGLPWFGCRAESTCCLAKDVELFPTLERVFLACEKLCGIVERKAYAVQTIYELTFCAIHMFNLLVHSTAPQAYVRYQKHKIKGNNVLHWREAMQWGSI